MYRYVHLTFTRKHKSKLTNMWICVCLGAGGLITTERLTIAQHVWNTIVHLPNCWEIIPKCSEFIPNRWEQLT